MHVAEAGDGPPLLLLHGFPQHWWAWRKVIPGLAEHYRLICPDLRGAGWTDAPRDGYTSEQLVADVLALLDLLRVEKVDLLGYDWGGIVGFRVCLAHPERVGRFVALATPHPYPDLHLRALLSVWRIWPMFAIATPGLGPWLLQTGRQRLPRRLMTGATRDPKVFPPDDVEVFVSRLTDPARARAGSILYRDFILAEARRSGAGAYRGTRLSTPTLSLYGTVLYGNNDRTREHPEISAAMRTTPTTSPWSTCPAPATISPRNTRMWWWPVRWSFSLHASAPAATLAACAPAGSGPILKGCLIRGAQDDDSTRPGGRHD
jgi:pimeloyl-ACP methyl ester carboxylesterase